MASAGEIAEAGRIPGERIETEVESADSADFTTTEVELMSITAALVSGRRYSVRVHAGFSSDTSGDRLVARIREDTASGGTIMQNGNVFIDITSGIRYPSDLYAEFTAASTGDKTFVFSAQRVSGSGNCRLEAASTSPSYMWVNYIDG